MAGGGGGSASSFIVLSLQLLIACTLLSMVQAEICTGYGHICTYPNKCCANRCCEPQEDYEHTYRTYHWNVWNMWYFWFLVIFFMMSCFGGCGYWRRRQIMMAHHSRSHPALRAYTTTTTTTTYHCGRPTRVIPSLGIPLYARVGLGYSPQVSSNCASETQTLFPAPPPYAEVMTKPDVYPPRYDPDSLPPYPGDPVYNSTVPVPGAVVSNLATESESSEAAATSGTVPSYSPQAPGGLPLDTTTGAAAGSSGMYRAAANSSQARWRPPPASQAGAAGMAAALPDEMDSNGNEINSNIYPDNANLQPTNHQPGNYNPGGRLPGGNNDSGY